MGEIRIGISGWRYAPWRGIFYPDGLPQDRELAFASRAVNSLEINGSFYALQNPARYANWRDDAPKDFIFAVKAPRYITHTLKLKDVEKPLANFFASGLLQLGEKLGPILWQFPPSMAFEAGTFGRFLDLLPGTTHAALDCASHCSDRLKKVGYQEASARGTLRHAVEIRNESFACDAFVQMLRDHKVALVIADTAGKWPYLEDLTSDFVYLRLHGDKALYASGYTEQALARWETRIRTWSAGLQPGDAFVVDEHGTRLRKSRDIYCYFDNDQKVRAPFDARRLLERLDLTRDLETQPGVLQGIPP
ncbi:DUF72 domain-containing protein [Pseudomonas sp. JS3066]|uniref:DUF72 domain-containing protein n=1 Tax=unclassified Pseudomonas TaxID=196821 RepID=UPI0012D06C0E|nr:MULTISPECIES: DUF72 domain-containing protein [unclassified Pseudomonas]MDH4653649.1 DUF72 domain-containing protein [Pseudomonas sp. BN606]MRK22004.1 DUF72 domain-containing protein [Pseudomonas sp. JG-B]WVK95781.1 DUF72 domain-containing protein [Pseudomonas sp. JS3066]